MQEMVAALVLVGRGELGDTDVAGVEGGDEAPDGAALARRVPALEEHAQGRAELAAADQSAELEPEGEEPLLGRLDPVLALLGTEFV
jgi:hypothetical protein